MIARRTCFRHLIKLSMWVTALVRLAALIDWKFLADCFGSVCQTAPGQPGLPTRLVAGLFILKHMHNLSDEVLCARWGRESLPPILLR